MLTATLRWWPLEELPVKGSLPASTAIVRPVPVMSPGSGDRVLTEKGAKRMVYRTGGCNLRGGGSSEPGQDEGSGGEELQHFREIVSPARLVGAQRARASGE